MRPIRNRGVVYTGKVGRKMSVRVQRVSRRVFWARYQCDAGPLAGQWIKLEANSDGRTLPIVVRGQAGLYVCGRWIPAHTVDRS